MKIVFLLQEFPKLSESFIFNQVTGLLDLGLDVRILAIKENTSIEALSPELREKFRGRVVYPRLHQRSPEKLGRAAKRRILTDRLGSPKLGFGSLFDGARELIDTCNHSRLVRGKGTVGLWTGLAMITALEALGPINEDDAFIVHFGHVGLLSEFLCRVKNIRANRYIFFHGYDITQKIQEHGVEIYREVLDSEDNYLLPISERWKDKLLAIGASPDRTLVHHMGVDFIAYPFQFEAWSEQSPLRLVSVCRVVEKKGIEIAVRALAQLKAKDIEHFEYRIIGDGELLPDLIRLAEELGLSDQVSFLGSRQNHEINAYLRSAHLFLAPSLTAQNGDQEGIPVAIMEAMASGLPVVSTFHSGIPELIDDGHNGWLARENDANALAERLEYVMSHTATWPSVAENARDKVARDFDNRALNQALVDFIRSNRANAPS